GMLTQPTIPLATRRAGHNQENTVAIPSVSSTARKPEIGSQLSDWLATLLVEGSIVGRRRGPREESARQRVEKWGPFAYPNPAEPEPNRIRIRTLARLMVSTS